MGRDRLTRCNEWMFRTVKCTAFMKKAEDGRYINRLNDDEWLYCEKDKDGNEISRIIPEEDWGCSDFIKTYYVKSEKEFVGVVVDFKLITVTAELFRDYYDYDYGKPYDFVNRRIIEKVKCAKVYYGCGKSRFVPMDAMTLIDEDKE